RAVAVQDLFRSFHSLKGISAMVELREAEALAHEMETCLGLLRDRRAPLNAAAFESLIDATNVLEQVIAARRTGSSSPKGEDQIARLAAAFRVGTRTGTESGTRTGTGTGSGTVSESRTRQVWKVTFTPSPDLVARGVKVDTVRRRLADIGDIIDVTPIVKSGS